MLKNLNKMQRTAAEETEGYLLVLAGAGSGKTALLTHRFAHILEVQDLQPQNIMCVTFTNKAALEMKERIKKLLNEQYPMNQMWIGTFHGICIRLLIKYHTRIGLKPNFVIVDDNEQAKIINDLKERYTTIKLETDQIINLISRIKENMISEEEISTSPLITVKDKNFVLLVQEYNQMLRMMNGLDFNDIINRLIECLTEYPEIKEEVQEQFHYLMVDESQDLNFAQAIFAKLITGKYNNLMMVGDPDQNIYSWRGANLDIILNFSSKAKVVNLEQNYRSTSTIVEASNSLITNNTKRLKKTVTSTKGVGRPIVYYTAATEWAEGSFIANVISYMKKSNFELRYDDFAVLARTNNQLRFVEDSLIKASIPYQIVNGTSLFDREEIKDTIAYLRLLINDYDYLSFLRIVTKPKRGIADAGSKLVVDYAIKHNKGICQVISEDLTKDEFKKLRKKEELEVLRSHIIKYREILDKAPLYKIIKSYIFDVGYLTYLNKSEDKVSNFYDFVGIIETWNDSNDEDEHIRSMIDVVQKFSLINDIAEENSKNNVKLMTCHGAKGSEYDTVFIVGVEEGIFPSRQNIGVKTLLEEERRLFYVAMTRAKNNLYITNVKYRRNFDRTKIMNPPSRFINEIPEEHIKEIT